MPRDILHRLPPYTIDAELAALSEKEYTWGLKQRRVPKAWERSRGAGIRVAVLDTGCQINHPDLNGQVVAQRDFTGSSFDYQDRNAHGTHCAGVIGAKENDRGVVGVAPDLRKDDGGLIIGKVLGDDGSGRGSWVAQGILWAVDEGAHIISMSLGSAMNDPRIQQAVQRANKAGSIVIAAAGNDGPSSRPNFPGALPETVSVSATDEEGRVADFSSRGAYVDVAAPGVRILSTVPGSRYAKMSGTSMATPFVAGVVTLVMSAGQKFNSAAELKFLLSETAEDVGKPGRDQSYGYGLIKPGSMLPPKDEQPEPPETPEEPEPPADKTRRISSGRLGFAFRLPLVIRLALCSRTTIDGFRRHPTPDPPTRGDRVRTGVVYDPACVRGMG